MNFVYRENHPYKYGYGKLLHSGYHYVDLLAWLLRVGQVGPKHKRPERAKLHTTAIYPADFMNWLDEQDYRRLLRTSHYEKFFAARGDGLFDNMGELDFYALMQLFHGRDTITTCSLSLLQSGFSRRSWAQLPVDTYKGNGRIRHERVNIQLGPLANIQIHSYQAGEVKDHYLKHSGVGGLEHFEIYVFRNADLIGGPPVERLTLEDVEDGQQTKLVSLGHMERAKERCLLDFLFRKDGYSDLLDHSLSIHLLSQFYNSLYLHKQGKDPQGEFPLHLNDLPFENEGII